MKILENIENSERSEQQSTVSNKEEKHTSNPFHLSKTKEKAKKVKNNLEEISDEMKQQLKGSFIHSVGVKLFVTIILGVLLCVILMGQFAYNKAEQIIEEQAIISGETAIEQLGINLDNKLLTYQDLTLSVLIDEGFHSDLESATYPKDDIEKLEAMRNITNKLQNYLFSNEDITGIALIPINDNLTTLTVGSSQVEKVNEIKQEPWFNETVKLSGQLKWLEPRPTSITHSGNAPSFAMARLLTNTSTSKADYVLLFDIRINSLQHSMERLGTPEGGEVAIIGPSFNYAIHHNTSLISQPIQFEFDKLDEVSSKNINLAGEEMLLIQSPLDTNGWFLFELIPVHTLTEDAAAIREMTVIISIVAIFIALLIALFVVINVSAPLVKIRDLLVQGADGNLKIRAQATKRKDEIGQLGRSFNLMMEKMSDLAIQTKYSAESVLNTAEVLTQASQRTASSAREIAVATEEIANGATSLAGEAERGNDITITINNQMQSVLLANEDMKLSATQVEQASLQGATFLNELMNQTTHTEELTRHMVEKVDTLSDSTKSIVQILDMLNAVNKQTNILSLNATIEAARAGSAGKGFMVVASEIRELADQSTKSIDIVGGITDKIQSEIKQTVNALTEVYPLFQQQVNSVKNANEIFEAVQIQMSKFIDKLDQVTQSVNHLERTQSILNETMSNVSAVAEQSSATSEEVASLSNEQLNVSDNLVTLSQQLSEMSQSLKESISKFKV